MKSRVEWVVWLVVVLGVVGFGGEAGADHGLFASPDRATIAAGGIEMGCESDAERPVVAARLGGDGAGCAARHFGVAQGETAPEVIMRPDRLHTFVDELEDRAYVSRMPDLTLLAPHIVRAILDGNEPCGLSPARLTKPFPVLWGERYRELGFHKKIEF